MAHLKKHLNADDTYKATHSNPIDIYWLLSRYNFSFHYEEKLMRILERDMSFIDLWLDMIF